MPAPAVVEAIGRALDLDAAGREHLQTLIDYSASPGRRRTRGAQRVRPGLYQLLDALDEPALLLGRRTDILASNRMAKALFTDFDRLPVVERNYARWMFLDDNARSLFADWEAHARTTVETLRLDNGNDPEDQETAALVTELRERSYEFRRWWDNHQVYQRTHGSKHLCHPLVGELTVGYETLVLPGDPDTSLFLYTTEPGSPSREAMNLLASWELSDTSTPRSSRP